MIPAQLRDFIDSLLKASNDGRASWSSMPFGNGFTCEKNEFTIAIWNYEDEESGVDIIEFRINDTKGQTRFLVNEHQQDFRAMQILFSSASTSANQFATKLKDLF